MLDSVQTLQWTAHGFDKGVSETTFGTRALPVWWGVSLSVCPALHLFRRPVDAS